MLKVLRDDLAFAVVFFLNNVLIFILWALLFGLHIYLFESVRS